MSSTTKKAPAKFEETLHYDGQASVKFYPGMHGYFVTDPVMGFKNQRMGGGTSITGMLAKGQGLMLYPMYEMKKYLKVWARTHTFEQILDSQLNWEDILKEGTQAHVRKSDRGKSVGTDAHAWVELWMREAMRVQIELGLQGIEDITPEVRDDYNKELQMPEIPAVEELGLILRRSYIDVFKAAKPRTVDEYRQLTKLLFEDAEIQEAMFTEASMLNRSITAAKAWLDIHDVFVHGTEDTVYSRSLQVCGKYDGDITVRCSERCNWCFTNGDEEKVINILNEQGSDFTYAGRYISDFKSTNSSTEAPKGIYKEYLIQCAVYELAKTEEFPELHYDGHLILNGSKNEPKYDQSGQPISNIPGKPYSPFNTHFSFNTERSKRAVELLVEVKNIDYEAGKEIKASA